MRIPVHVTPRSVRDEVAGWRGGELSVRVTVPPGVGHGTLLRLGGLGRTGTDGARGDLYLRVAVEEWGR